MGPAAPVTRRKREKPKGLPVAMGTSSRLKEGRTMDSRASPHCTHGAQPQEMLSNGTGGLPPSYKAPERRGSEASLNSNVDACRICHCEAEPGAPLISPCVCSGSLKFVHQACLQQWIKSADTKSCELCKYDFEMTTRIKPFRKWQKLQMSTVERRKIMCSVTFHLIAITCVIWSLYVLIDRTTEEIKQGVLEWPFWTKLIVVAIGFTGGLVFMYVQCKMYVHLCRRWRAYNRVIYIQNCPKLGGNKQPFAGSPRHGHGDGDGDKLSDSSNNSMQETELV